MPRSRILQVVINTLLFVFLTFQVVDLIAKTRWRVGGQYALPFIALLIFVACMAALVGSIRLNLQILRNSKFYISPPTSFLRQLYALVFALALLYIALERRSIAPLTYDSHLSTHYMVIEVPEWRWLQFSRVDEFSIQDYQILNLLGYVLGISLFFTTKNVSLPMSSANILCNKVNPSLIKYQIASGIIFLLLALICLFAFIERLTAFRAQVEFDPAMMNLSNLSGFGFRGFNFLLLILYGQWILRDGLRLRSNLVKEQTS